MHPRLPSFLYHIAFALPLFALDQITKQWIVNNFPDPTATPYHMQRVIEVIPGFFNIVRVHNTGMAWGLLNGSPFANVLFISIAAIAMTFLTVLWLRGAFETKWTKLAVTLLVSGIFGNIFDRVTRGYVVDFLDFWFGSYSFPVFNVADSCICIAAGLLFLTAIKSGKEEGEAKQESSDETETA
ncbi:MAG: signal peptidase II [Verrucomicrobiota bacterium]